MDENLADSERDGGRVIPIQQQQLVRCLVQILHLVRQLFYFFLEIEN